MWRALLTCLVLLVPATGALAAERVLLHPQDLSAVARPAAAPEGFKALRKAASDQGTVKVIVGLSNILSVKSNRRLEGLDPVSC